MHDDARPVYLKLRDEIIDLVLDGRIAEGDALPSVRAFAAAQGANPLTVAKAYQTFQDEGLVVSRRGIGLFLASGARETLRRVLLEEFHATVWPQTLARIRRLGINPATLVEPLIPVV